MATPPDRSPSAGLIAGLPRPERLILVLGALAAFGPMSVDMYLPSLPDIAAEFAAPTSSVQLTLSAFFLGFAAGQLVYGPLSDRFGRRPVLLAGIGLYVLTSAACALSAGIGFMIAARGLQALGGGAGTVVSRAIVRDLFAADRAAQVMSLMMLVMSVAPLVAPLLGGQLLYWLGWRAIFWVLAAFGAACLLAVARAIPETNPPQRRHPLPLAAVRGAYLRVLRHRQASGSILVGSLALAGMFAYISGTPFIYIEIFHVPPQLYGLLFGLNIVGMMGGAYLNSRLVTRLGSAFLLSLGTGIVCGAGLLLLALAWTGTGGLLGIVVPLFFYVGALNLISANAIARTLQHFPHTAGTAAALFGAAQFTLGAVAGTLVGQLHNGTAVPMAAVIAACGVLSLAVERLLSRG